MQPNVYSKLTHLLPTGSHTHPSLLARGQPHSVCCGLKPLHTVTHTRVHTRPHTTRVQCGGGLACAVDGASVEHLGAVSAEPVTLTHRRLSVGVAVRAQSSLQPTVGGWGAPSAGSLFSTLFPKSSVPSLSLMRHFLVSLTPELVVTATASDDCHSEAGSPGTVTKSEPAPQGHQAKAREGGTRFKRAPPYTRLSV